ncbi:MAG: PH domain-containing protein [Rhodospirillales bacterium]|nr:PH domain-containing protein [Rhodospirillales bacterium]
MTEPSKPARDGDYGLLRDAADVAVEGSLAQPPIVLRQDRLKLALCCAGAAALALLLLATVRFSSIIDTVLFCVVGLSALDYGLGAIFPATLTLSPAGLVRRSVYRTVEFSWQDITGFRWYRTRMMVNMVMAEHSDAYRATLGWRSFFGAATALGGFWELPAQRVVDELTAALGHWAPRKLKGKVEPYLQK